jgi:hypothetical protein
MIVQTILFSRPGELNNYSYTYIPPALGAKGIHDINGSFWNNYPANNNGQEGRVLPLEDGGFIWPSAGLCYNSPKSGDGRWQDLIEYMRACGVNPSRLVEATFEGGDNKYDTRGSYVGGVIFWAYIPESEVININWHTGEILTGKDFDGLVTASSYNWGQEAPVNPMSDLDISFVAFTNDPNKNTANWWW